MNPVPRWRIAAAIAVLSALAGFGVLFTPYYVHNLQLQSYVGQITHAAAEHHPPDQELRTAVVAKAKALKLPVAGDNVHILHSPEGLRIDVRYFVRVTLPGYTVDLHFYPGAGSR